MEATGLPRRSPFGSKILNNVLLILPMNPNVQPRQVPEFLSPATFNCFMSLAPLTPPCVISNMDYKYNCHFIQPPNFLETPHSLGSDHH